MTGGRHISQEDLALHALQALSAEESAAVRLHVAECAQCRAELAALSGDLALVAMSVEQQPVPEGARERFVQRIAASPQRAAAAPVIPMDSKRPAKPASRWIPWSAAAALVLLCLGLGMRIQVLNQKLAETAALEAAQAAQNAQARAVLDVLMAHKAQRVLLTAGKTPPEPSARAVYLPSRGALIMEASNLRPLPAGKTYELWVIPANGAAPIPAGLFRPDATGSASVVLPQIPAGVEAKAFGVTVENASGADKPTLPIVLAGAAPPLSD